MRTAFVASLILAAGLVSAAQAQDQTPPAAPAAPATAPAPPATAPATPATPAPPATPDASAPAPVAAEPAPTLPTTGDGAVMISVIEKICVPLVRGGKLDDLAKAAGMKQNRRDGTWVMGLGGDKNYTVTLFPVGSNKDVCRGEVHYAPGQDKPIVSAINIWSFLHQPELILQANYVNTDPDGIKRVRKSWEHLEANSSTAVNFSTMTKPDDSPINAKWGTAEFFYQERTF
jgi:hypothetical protein